MVEFDLDTDDSILHLRPKGALAANDFAKIAHTVDPYIEADGKLAGIVVEAQSFRQ